MKAMSSRIFEHVAHPYTPTYSMGSNLSYTQDRNYTLSSEYGTTTKIMGSGTSRSYESISSTSRYKGRSHSKTLDGQSSVAGRPLPKGPGPLLPSSDFKISKRKTEKIPTQGRGPVKGNHLLARDGPDIFTETDASSPKSHRSLSRLKSKSLDDVRKAERQETHNLNPRKIINDIDMKKARKTFKISRSPSYDNIKNAGHKTESDQRSLLDRLSKMNTDEALKKVNSPVTVNKSSPCCQSKTPTLTKSRDILKPLKNLSLKGSLQHQTETHTIKPPLSNGDVARRSSLARSTVLSKEGSLQRRSSDSAYESNGSTGSSSGSSSPKYLREQVEAQICQSSQGCFGKGLVGLRNLGNTCFMNSILQCLRCSRKLRSVFCNDVKMKELLDEAPKNKGGLAKAFTNIMREMWSQCSTGSTVTPQSLKQQVQRYAPRFVGYNQQDSQEFLRFLLEGLHDDLNLNPGKINKSHGSGTTTLSDADQARVAWERYETREKSIISDLFVGQLKSTLTCTECKYRSLTFDPFWDLSLPIPTLRSKTSLISGKVSLDDCFRRFTQEEVLDGDEKPTCERCKKRRKCSKQFSIERFPQILVIHLKRFSGLRYRTKLETLVDFPLDLNLSNFAASNETRRSQAQYHLYGISNHSGGTYSGHYTAYCKHPDTDDWFNYSDSRISKLDHPRIITEDAYVLFYELSNQMSVL